MADPVTRFRFTTLSHGAIEVLAPSEEQAWSRFLAAGYSAGAVLGRPEAKAVAGEPVRLSEVLAAVRGGEDRP